MSAADEAVADEAVADEPADEAPPVVREDEDAGPADPVEDEAVEGEEGYDEEEDEDELFEWTEQDEACSKMQGLQRIMKAKQRIRDAVRKNYELGFDPDIGESPFSPVLSLPFL